jgi:hypothetical protein
VELLSTKVELYFGSYENLEIKEFLPDYQTIRLEGLVSLKTPKGWTDPEIALLDTGAPISVIPSPLWKNITYTKIANYEIQGIVPKEDCKIPAIIAEISCFICDKNGNETKEIKTNAFLVKSERVPLIIGFRNLLSKFKVCFDFENNTAFLKEK